MSLQQILSKDNLEYVKNSIILIEVAQECSVIADVFIDYIIKSCTQIIIKNLVCDKHFSYQSIIESNKSGSLFGDREFVIIRYQGSLRPTQDQVKDIQVLASELSHQDRYVEKVVIICERFEYKQRKNKLYASLMELVSSIVINGHQADLQLWTKFLLNKYNIMIEEKALNYLIHLNNNNIQQLYQNVLQLSYLYVHNDVLKGKHTISLQDVTDFVTNNSKHNVFMLSQAYLTANLKEAIAILAELNSSAESSILITWMLTDDVRKILAIKSIMQSNPKPSVQNISLELHIWGDRVLNLLNAARRISYKTLLEILDDLANIDLITKGVMVNHNGVELTNCIMRFA
jgi:DNA polymerase-3 subunit delta